MKVDSRQPNSKDCLVCGLSNPAGLGSRFYVCGRYLVGFSTLHPHLQSYPGILHGGVQAALLDEAIGRAIQIDDPSQWGVTVELETKYLKVVPDVGESKVVSRIFRQNRYFFEGVGILINPLGEVAAVAYAKYLRRDIEQISGHQFSADEWFVVPDSLDQIEIANEHIITLEQIIERRINDTKV